MIALRVAARSICVFVLCCIGISSGCGQSEAKPRPESRNVPLAAPPKTPLKPTETWPQWRGAGGQGIAQKTRLPAAWPDAPAAPFWRAALGSGWSSPIVADGKVVVTDRNDAKERTVAFDAESGKLLWERSHAVDFSPHAVGMRHGTGPKSTPLIDRGRVYSLGIAGWLECLDLKDGKVLWQINLPERFGKHQPLPGGRHYVNGETNVIVPVGEGEGAPVPLFGYTGSPTFTDQMLILSVGGEKGGTIMAFRADSGEVAWKALHENVSYSSPIIATVGGRKQVVVMTGPHVVGLDPQQGDVLWRHPFQIQYDESIGTPVASGDLVIVTATGRPLTALRISPDGDAYRAEIAWENNDLTSYLSSMLIHDGHVYGMNEGGEFVCIALNSGKSVWIDGHHGYYCSPVLADSRLLALNEQGELLVLAASPKGYRELGRSRLADDATWTSPAVAGSRIYVRSEQELRAFDFAP